MERRRIGKMLRYKLAMRVNEPQRSNAQHSKYRQYFFFLAFGLSAQHAGSQFSDQEVKAYLLQWKCRVLTTGPPGTTGSPKLSLDNIVL